MNPCPNSTPRPSDSAFLSEQFLVLPPLEDRLLVQQVVAEKDLVDGLLDAVDPVTGQRFGQSTLGLKVARAWNLNV